MKAKILGAIFIAILLLSISCSGSGGTAATTATEIPGPPSPEELAAQDFVLPELPRITSEQLKKLMDDEEPLLVVDTRIQFMFNLGHLPETINIPTEPEEEQAIRFQTLPKDRKIIFYCDWPDDFESAVSVDRLLKMDAGFNPENIFVLWKGYFRWQELGYSIMK